MDNESSAGPKKKVKKIRKQVKKKRLLGSFNVEQDHPVKERQDFDPEVKKPPSKGKRFKEQFRLFAMFGDVRNSGSTITHENSIKWLKQASIIDNRIITIHDAEIHFINELKRQRSLTILEYINFVKALSSEKGIESSLIIDRLIDSGPPHLNSPSSIDKRPSEPIQHTLPIYLTKIALDMPGKRSCVNLESQSLLPIPSLQSIPSKENSFNKIISVRSKKSVDSVRKFDFLPTAKTVSLHLAKCFENVKHLGVSHNSLKLKALLPKIPECKGQKVLEANEKGNKLVDSKIPIVKGTRSEKEASRNSKQLNISATDFHVKIVNQTVKAKSCRLTDNDMQVFSPKTQPAHKIVSTITSRNSTLVKRKLKAPLNKLNHNSDVIEKGEIAKRVQAKLELRTENEEVVKRCDMGKCVKSGKSYEELKSKAFRKKSDGLAKTEKIFNGKTPFKLIPKSNSSEDKQSRRMESSFSNYKMSGAKTTCVPDVRLVLASNGDFALADFPDKTDLVPSEPFTLINITEEESKAIQSCSNPLPKMVQEIESETESYFSGDSDLFVFEARKKESKDDRTGLKTLSAEQLREMPAMKWVRRKRVKKRLKDPETLVQNVFESTASSAESSL